MASPRVLISGPNLSAVWPTLCSPPPPSLATHGQLPSIRTTAQLLPGLLFSLSHPYSVFSTWHAEWTFQNIHQVILFPCVNLPMVPTLLEYMLNSLSWLQGPTWFGLSLPLWLPPSPLCLTLRPHTFLWIISRNPLSPVSGCQIVHCLGHSSSHFFMGLLLLVI